MTRHGRKTSTTDPQPLEQIPVWWSESDESGDSGDGAPRDIAPGDVAPGDVAPGDVAPGARSAGVESLLSGLNAEQRRAVCHGDGPLLVVAGAGTGKTQVITRRIAWLIGTRRARPSEILALTFTDKAADEMQARVDQLVPYGYTDAAISTFHAFGDRVVREFALELGLPHGLRVLSRPEVVIFLRERLFGFELDEYRPLGDPTRFLAALATLFSRCKDEDVAPAAYLAYAAAADGRERCAAARGELSIRRRTTSRRRGRGGAPPDRTRRAYDRYQSLLLGAGLVDFGDQVSMALRLLRESPATRVELQRRFRYVLVDEFQDTNPAQSELVELLAATHGNITVVGDDDQSIYKFRGAAISNILEFKRRHPSARQVVLRRNYRSRAPILDSSYRLIRFNDPDRLEVRNGIDKRLLAERGGSERAGPAHGLHHAARRRRTGSRREIAARIGGRRTSSRFRRARPGERGRGSGPAQSEPGRRSVALLGDVGVVRPARRFGCCWPSCGPSRICPPSVDLYALAASDVYGLGGPGSDRDRQQRPTHATARSGRSIEELVRQPGLLRV